MRRRLVAGTWEGNMDGLHYQLSCIGCCNIPYMNEQIRSAIMKPAWPFVVLLSTLVIRPV